jgi:hypothetical protein
MDIKHIDLAPGESVLLQIHDDVFVVVRAATPEERADDSTAAPTPVGATIEPAAPPDKLTEPNPSKPGRIIYVPNPPDKTIYVPSPPDKIMGILPQLRSELGFEPTELVADTSVRLGGFADLRNK